MVLRSYRRLNRYSNSVRRGLDGKAVAGEMCRDQLARGRVVVDHQNGAARALVCRRTGLGCARLHRRHRRSSLRRQAHREDRPFARRARHGHIAAHQPAQPAADRETEPGAAKLAAAILTDGTTLKSLVSRLYGYRSKIAHGSILGLDERLRADRGWAEWLAAAMHVAYVAAGGADDHDAFFGALPPTPAAPARP